MKKQLLRYMSILLTTFLLSAASIQAEEQVANAIESIAVTSAKDYVSMNSDAVIMDVRTPAEFDMSHITGAMNLNVQDEDFASMVAGLDKEKTYLVHCTKNPADGRSSRALATMQSLGFRNLYSLEGGYLAWKDAELPLSEAGPDTEQD